MKRIFVTTFLIIIVALLGACSEKHNVAEDMYTHLERSVELEAPFTNAQKELVQLEQQENELYRQMIEINMNELEQVNELADEALDLVEERRSLLELEMESVQAAKNEFDEIEQYIEDLDEEPRALADDLIETMNHRYDTFLELYEAYIASLDEDATLYEMLKNEELVKEELDEQVDKVNASYSNVKTAQESFNEYTNDFNELKRQFYEAAGLEVSYAEEQN